MGKEKQKSYKGFRLSKSGEFLSFTHTLDGKKIRIGHSQGFPKKIYDYSEADLAREKLLDTLDRSRKRREHKVIWIKHFQKEHERLKKFNSWCNNRNMRNAKTQYGLIKNHVLPFFLQERKVIDPHEWFYFYEDFKEWLDERKPLRNNCKQDFLADNSKNNIIKAMHSFFKYLEKVEKLGPFRRCEEYPPGGFRGIEDLVSDDEQSLLLTKLRDLDPKMATYIKLLNLTGMRPNEALGLHVNSIVLGKWQDGEEWVLKRIVEAGYNVYGYIVLRDQPASYKLQDVSGAVPRRPLKGKKKIAPEHFRFIPIIDYALAKELAELKASAIAEFKKERKVVSREDALLFGFTYGQISKKVRELFDEIGCHTKSLYCLRHTFITRFSKALGGDTRLTEIIVGHTDKRMMIRYNKLRQEMEGQAIIDAQEEMDHFEIKAIEI